MLETCTPSCMFSLTLHFQHRVYELDSDMEEKKNRKLEYREGVHRTALIP